MSDPPAKKKAKRPTPTAEEAAALGAELLDLLGREGGCTKPELRAVLKRGAAASFQRDSDGASALMLAAGAGAGELVATLLMYGAPWNALDRSGRCAGQYALQHGQQAVVDQLVNAGVMAEMVLGAVMKKRPGRQDELDQLHLGEDAGGASSSVSAVASAASASTASGASSSSSSSSSSGAAAAVDAAPAAGDGGESSGDAGAGAGAGDAYLDRSVRYEGDTLLDTEDDAVMMEWERPLMEEHATLLCGPPGGEAVGGAGGAVAAAAAAAAAAAGEDGEGIDVLNVGFGMGIFDGMVQRRSRAAGLGRVRSHTICEAHPAVHARMLADGWAAKPGVRVVFGRWQEQLAALTAAGGRFDAIFFDTYGEHHSDMAEFHAALPGMLRRGGTYSFFNGMCPDNVFFQGVACQVVQLELEQLGLATEFRPVKLAPLQGKVWEGVKRRYWHDREEYFMPVSRWIKAAAPAEEEEEEQQQQQQQQQQPPPPPQPPSSE